MERTDGAKPSCGHVVRAHLEHLHGLWRDGRYPLPADALSLAAVLADRSFRGGRFAGLVAFTTNDAEGVNHHLHTREVLRIEREVPADAFPWRCLSQAEWEAEGLHEAVLTFARGFARRLPTRWPNDPFCDTGE